jgi:anti-sigma regulatory factor (Ser/Thr protein kinase)
MGPVTTGIDIFKRLAYEPVSVVEASGALSMLDSCCNPDTLETLRLLVTELVGNSIRHASEWATGEIELWVQVTPDRVRVEVSDSGPGFAPGAGRAGPNDTAGRGLLLVEALSDRWGARQADERTRVWCELVGEGARADGTGCRKLVGGTRRFESRRSSVSLQRRSMHERLGCDKHADAFQCRGRDASRRRDRSFLFAFAPSVVRQFRSDGDEAQIIG